MTAAEQTAEPAGPAAEPTGPAGLPRSNGELVFDEPWQSRAFGLAAAAVEAGRFTWDEFRPYLVREVAAAPGTGEPAGYYRCWLSALEKLASGHGLASAAEVSVRTARYAARPAGHDHRH
ncbi:MAG TPA: nitrile hydratase accessory protein [Acidimicrobiaceae bacterium]|nr:nitrile hydratase accessory protein [Acidimicrobiaceae bacterium]HCB37127.1 nitrile hydratase accessory protein [Acidimicrobiaceae bacterium]